MSSRVYQRKERSDRRWWLDFTDATGRRRRIPTRAATKREATRILNGYLGKVAREEHLGLPDESRIPFAEAAALYLEHVRATRKPRTYVAYDAAVRRRLLPAFPGALRSVTRDRVDDLISERLRAGDAPATVRQAVAVLKAILTFGVERRWLVRNPLAGRIESLPTGRNRERFLSVDELRDLVESCENTAVQGIPGPYLARFVEVAANTGMRRNEILSLTPQTVNLERGVALLADTKVNVPQRRYLNDAAVAALRAVPHPLTNKPYFPFRGVAVSRAFRVAADRAGMTDVRLHDCRHSFASWLVAQGTPLRAVQELLGHSSITMTERYAHVSEETRRSAVSGLSVG